MKRLRRQLWWKRLTSGLPPWACRVLPHRWMPWTGQIRSHTRCCRRCCEVQMHMSGPWESGMWANPRLNEAVDWEALDAWRSSV